ELADHLGDKVCALLLSPSADGGVELRLGLHDGADALHFDDDDISALHAVLRAAGVSCVHFHHTLGLPAPVVGVADALGVPWLITVHDYYWLNGNPTLTWEDGRYRGYSDQIDHPEYPLPEGM